MKKSNFVRTMILAGSLLLQLTTLCLHSPGAAGDVDLSFDPGSGLNGPVTAVGLQPDGKVIIGGGFTTVRGLARSGMARLNPDGSGDSSFNLTMASSYGAISAITVQADGKVLAGHYYGIARLNSNGSPDTNFFASIDSLYDEYYGFASVDSIAVQVDGKVLIGGQFYTVSGANVNYGIARLNADGSLDSNFNSGLYPDYYTWIYSIAVQADGKVLVAGTLSTINGTNVSSGIARLHSNGSLDNSFNPGTGANSTFSCVVLQPDGKALIGGDFTLASGTNRNRIARLNANGSLDASFILGPGANSFVSEVALQSDGKVCIGGSFTDFNGTGRKGIARLNPDGSLDASFNPGTGVDPGYSSWISSVVVQANGKVLIGGAFTTVNGTNRNRMARLNVDGGLDGSFLPGQGLNGGASLVVEPDGKVLIGGGVRLNADGSLDNSYIFVPNTNFSPNIEVPGTDYVGAECSAVQADGKVLIGGYTATTIGVDDFGNPYYSFGCFVARVHADGSRDTNFNLVVGGHGSGWLYRDPWSPTVRELALQPDGKILVGGLFWEFGGTNRNGIARLNANGTLDSSFNPGFGGSVHSMLLQPDGRVLVGSSAGLAWLNSDGTRDPCFNPTINISYFYPLDVVLQPDGKVLVGGSFSTVNGVSRNGIARLNGNGSLDTSFDPGTGADAPVRAIALQPDGNVLIGGDFLTVNGVVRPHVARLFGGASGPRLRLFSTDNNAWMVAWPSSSAGFTLQQSANFAAANWINVTTEPTIVGSENQVGISPPTGQRFFRLFSDAPGMPPAPSPVAPTLTGVAGDGLVSLSWTTFPGASGHHVQRATSHNGPFVTIANPATANHIDSAVANGTTYYYIVSVIYPCGESSNSVPVGVTPKVAATVHVQSITMSFVRRGSRYETRAVVKVVDNTGAPFSGATVTGDFIGAIHNAGRTGVTDANGDAIIDSSSTIKNGTVTFTVVGIATGSISYNDGANVVTSATITR